MQVHCWCYKNLISMNNKFKYCGVHKCLVSNCIDICSKYKNYLKPVTCHYQLPTHSAWSQLTLHYSYNIVNLLHYTFLRHLVDNIQIRFVCLLLEIVYRKWSCGSGCCLSLIWICAFMWYSKSLSVQHLCFMALNSI